MHVSDESGVPQEGEEAEKESSEGTEAEDVKPKEPFTPQASAEPLPRSEGRRLSIPRRLELESFDEEPTTEDEPPSDDPGNNSALCDQRFPWFAYSL